MTTGVLSEERIPSSRTNRGRPGRRLQDVRHEGRPEALDRPAQAAGSRRARGASRTMPSPGRVDRQEDELVVVNAPQDAVVGAERRCGPPCRSPGPRRRRRPGRNRGATWRMRSSAARDLALPLVQPRTLERLTGEVGDDAARASVSPSSGLGRSKRKPTEPMTPPRTRTAARAHARRSPATSWRVSWKSTRAPRAAAVTTRFVAASGSSATRPQSETAHVRSVGGEVRGDDRELLAVDEPERDTVAERIPPRVHDTTRRRPTTTRRPRVRRELLERFDLADVRSSRIPFACGPAPRGSGAGCRTRRSRGRPRG